MRYILLRNYVRVESCLIGLLIRQGVRVRGGSKNCRWRIIRIRVVVMAVHHQRQMALVVARWNHRHLNQYASMNAKQQRSYINYSKRYPTYIHMILYIVILNPRIYSLSTKIIMTRQHQQHHQHHHQPTIASN